MFFVRHDIIRSPQTNYRVIHFNDARVEWEDMSTGFRSVVDAAWLAEMLKVDGWQLEPSYDLAGLQSVIHQTAKDKGWWEKPRTTGDLIALMHSELSEALEEFRTGHEPSEVYYSQDADNAGSEKPEGVMVEVADCIIRALDFAASHGVNLGEMVRSKMHYNNTRAYRHGGKTL